MNKYLVASVLSLLMILGAGKALASTAYPALDCESEAETCSATVPPKGQFSISVAGNPSTGYSWALDYDSNYLQLDSTDSESLCPSTTTDGITQMVSGCGTTETFNFTALKEGAAALTMNYSRVWESVQPAQQKVYDITISNEGTEGSGFCIQVITPAKNLTTGECVEYPTPCDVPSGWEKVSSCSSDGTAQILGPITIDKPLSEMNTDELLETLINLLLAILSGK